MNRPRAATPLSARSTRACHGGLAVVALILSCGGEPLGEGSASGSSPWAADAPPREAPGAAESLDAAVEGAFSFAAERLAATAADTRARHPDDFARFYPTSTETTGASLGRWKLDTADDWRSGFFPGALWQLHRRTGGAAYLEEARAWSKPIEDLKDDPIDYDIGNRFTTTFGLAYRFEDDTSDPDGTRRAHAREMILAAAATLDERFDMHGIPVGALRALDTYMAPYPVYIDGMMNLELLFLGWDASGRPPAGPPATWYAHAVRSAVTTMDQNVRADGSTYHIVQHDDGTHGTPPDGAVYDKISDQGYASESTWSRGQAWALYGFTMVYRFTQDDPTAKPARFLDTARRAADFFVARLPSNFVADPYNHVAGDFVPPSDFDAALGEPAGPYNDANGDHVFGDRKPPLRAFVARDSSAAAAAASGLFELCTLVPDIAERTKYREAGERILRSLLTFTGPDGELVYLARHSPHRGILANGSVAWGYPTSSLIYGDYYLLEAMNRYRALRAGRHF